MKRTLQAVLMLLAWVALFRPGSAQAQTPSLEFAAGAGNPPARRPTVTPQVITYQNNTDNPTGNTFVATTPAIKATYSFNNQVYTTVPTTTIGTGTGVVFGAGSSGTTMLPSTALLFPTLNTVFTYFTDNVYTSSHNVAAGTGITQASNNGVG